MATTGGTNNQTKFFGSGSISLGSIKDFFGGNTNNIKFSKYYRKTSVNIPTSQFGSNAYEHYVPDATENDTVKTGGNNHAFSDFRGNGDDGVIKDYLVVQTGTDVNYNLSANPTTTWNNNFHRNVPKTGRISGRVVSYTQTTQNGSQSQYDHGNDSALIFGAEAINMDIDVDSDATGNPSSAGVSSNERGIFGVGGIGERAGGVGPKVGGTAMYVVQNQNSGNALANGSGIININLGNGRVLAGGGGGHKGTPGNPGNAGNAGNPNSCNFNSSKTITLHGPDSGGVNFRSMPKCNDTAKGCGNKAQNAIYNIGGVNIGGFCTGNQNRKRCRNRKGGNRERGESKCFGHVVKTCNFVHNFAGNPAPGGDPGNGGNAGFGYRGQGSENISTVAGGTNGNSGNNGNNGNCSNCDPKSGYVVTTIGGSAGNCGNPGNAGNSGNGGVIGGTYGQSALGGSGAKGGHAVFSLTKPSVKVNSANHAKGDLSNVTT